MPPKARSTADAATELYSPAMTSKTYDRLVLLTRTILDAGFPAIVDATNLKHSQRQLFWHLAQEKRVSFVILDFQAPEAVLRERVQRRELARQDASEATISVLERQLCTQEALTANERAASIVIKAESVTPIAELIDQLKRFAMPNIDT